MLRQNQTWEVYIIQTESGKYYTGITNNFERRFLEHSGAKKGARFFRLSKPSHVLYREACLDRSAASIREAQIKKMTKEQKAALIAASAASP